MLMVSTRLKAQGPCEGVYSRFSIFVSYELIPAQMRLARTLSEAGVEYETKGYENGVNYLLVDENSYNSAFRIVSGLSR
jgi:hypothetical protein